MGVKMGAADVCLPHTLALIHLILNKDSFFFF